MLDHIPLERPHTPLLDQVDLPADLREMAEEDLPELAKQLREYLLFTVGQTGGHFGAGLGVVELTIALHYVLNTPDDKLVWDVGHQTYPHKILTGRRDQMASIRQLNGIAGFPKRKESPYDAFGVGHSSTSISAALGMAAANKTLNIDAQAVAVIGDGAMTAGMAFEALNHAADTGTDILVVLNDNNMSISKNVGGLANYFSKIWASKTYTSFREGGKKVLNKMPSARELVRRTEEHMKGMISPATLFEELGFYYVGPIDGHDLSRLVHDIRNMLAIKGPKLLHVITQKGKGFSPAEDDPVSYHALNKIEAKVQSDNTEDSANTKDNTAKTSRTSLSKRQKYQDIFGQWLCDIARDDQRTIGITPAMCEGSGMVKFSEEFPQRYYDVAIAEQHAVTFAAGLACENLKPVVAIYSTFLQRAYDQLIHDVAIQNLDVTFAIDRSGLVGEDGPTHAGAFDLSFMRCVPNLIIATPSNENECRQLLFSAYHHIGPAAVRYPRGTGNGVNVSIENCHFDIGKGITLRKGKKVCLLNFGALLDNAQDVAEKNNYTLCDMRWAKPIDKELILQHAKEHDMLVTIEDNVIAGGAGSAVNEFILNIQDKPIKIINLGLPDTFDDHGKRDELLKNCGLDITGIEEKIKTSL